MVMESRCLHVRKAVLKEDSPAPAGCGSRGEVCRPLIKQVHNRGRCAHAKLISNARILVRVGLIYCNYNATTKIRRYARNSHTLLSFYVHALAAVKIVDGVAVAPEHTERWRRRVVLVCVPVELLAYNAVAELHVR